MSVFACDSRYFSLRACLKRTFTTKTPRHHAHDVREGRCLVWHVPTLFTPLAPVSDSFSYDSGRCFVQGGLEGSLQEK